MKPFFCTIILFLCFIPIANTTTFDTLYVVSVDRLNVRSGPGTTHPKIASLKRNDTIKITRSTDKNWAEIMFNNKSAYISKKYLKKLIIKTEPNELIEPSTAFFSNLIQRYKKIGKLRNFIIVIVLIFLLRYAIRLIGIIDRKYLSYRSERGIPKILLRIINTLIAFFGTIFNTYFHILLGRNNNNNPAIWPVKSMIIISFFLLFFFSKIFCFNTINNSYYTCSNH